MALKDILVHLDADEGSIARLQLAMDLAGRHASGLSALFVGELSFQQRESRAKAELGLAAARDLDRLDDSMAADIAHSATRLRNLLVAFQKERGIEFEWQQPAGFSDTAIGRLIPYCDLCILGLESFFTGSTVDRDFCERLVLSTVTPIVFVPTQTKVSSLGKRIVVAWDSSRTAARAVNDAMTLIERAEQTTVVNVDCGAQQDGRASLELLQRRLRRHSAHVDAIQIRAPKESIAAALHAKALELGADLLVAGAFGHSRLKERIFGGVSRDLLQNVKLPVLMSH